MCLLLRYENHFEPKLARCCWGWVVVRDNMLFWSVFWFLRCKCRSLFEGWCSFALSTPFFVVLLVASERDDFRELQREPSAVEKLASLLLQNPTETILPCYKWVDCWCIRQFFLSGCFSTFSMCALFSIEKFKVKIMTAFGYYCKTLPSKMCSLVEFWYLLSAFRDHWSRRIKVVRFRSWLELKVYRALCNLEVHLEEVWFCHVSRMWRFPSLFGLATQVCLFWEADGTGQRQRCQAKLFALPRKSEIRWTK